MAEAGKIIVMITAVIAVFGYGFFPLLLGHLIWSMLNELTLIVHLPIFSVTFPANAFLLYEAIIQLVQMDLVKTEPILTILLGLDMSEGAYGPQFDRLEYRHKSFLANIGFTLVIWTSLFTVMLLIVPFKWCGSCIRPFRIMYAKVSDFIYYKTIIRFLL